MKRLNEPITHFIAQFPDDDVIEESVALYNESGESIQQKTQKDATLNAPFMIFIADIILLRRILRSNIVLFEVLR